MRFQSDPGTIRWKMHFRSPVHDVYEALATAEGRARYWAESAAEHDGAIEFRILGHPPFEGRILETVPPHHFALEYFGTRVSFTLTDDGKGGTDLLLLAEDVPDAIRWEMVAGWVSVLMAMKGAVDFGVDLRNHDEERTWQQGYADN